MSIALIEEASRLPAVAHPRIPSWRIFADALLSVEERDGQGRRMLAQLGWGARYFIGLLPGGDLLEMERRHARDSHIGRLRQRTRVGHRMGMSHHPRDATLLTKG
jgi:hypothetical protein